MIKKVTGIGGIFFKCEDPKAIKEWYGEHLGLDVTQWGSTFQWIDPQNPEAKVMARTEWSPFPKDTTYFAPSEKQFMFNYRVDDLVALLDELRKAGVVVVGEMQEFPYGKFGWIMDPEGNKIELWEPKDDEL